ncbi:RNA 2',3'-cyclic phosphodiesterase [Streptomyces odonnellii]|uniref:RNA 2',3'-cyclic phosphodiesterase n=1 Tax=Streptomyces odonnellii TaxID=1417980 RepID=UPI001E5D99CB|nr:RNA 2',3'-cyclic phosphodiesterase [Streptomyces odonnellii]
MDRAGPLRWTGRDGWHFTLAFMGEVEDRVLPELTVRLERAARRTEPFPLRLHGGGQFGGQVLWAGAAGGIDALHLLAERAEAAAHRAGVPMDRHRRYRPHLTVARSRTPMDLGPYAEALSGPDGFEGTSWDVTELALVQSSLPVSGVPGEQPRYETVARYPLGRAAAGAAPAADAARTGNRDPGEEHAAPGR